MNLGPFVKVFSILIGHLFSRRRLCIFHYKGYKYLHNHVSIKMLHFEMFLTRVIPN